MAQVGRISGQLLSENLLRNEVDLAFDTDLLYFDVESSNIGVNTDGPSSDFNIVGNSKISQDAIALQSAEFGNITLDNQSTWSTSLGEINIRPTGPKAFIEWGKVLTPSFQIKDNYFKTLGTDENLGMDANGTGVVDYQSDTTVNGDLTVGTNLDIVADLQFGGNIIVGDSPLDTVAINPDFKQSIIPGSSETYSLGTDAKKWGNVHIVAFAGTNSVEVDSLITSDQVIVSSPNTIGTVQSNDALQLSSHNDVITIEELEFDSSGSDGVITNLLNTKNELIHTGEGYLRFGGTNGFVVPSGTNDERTSPEVGDTRWNTEEGYLECFDGSVYQVATGGGRVISEPIMEELGYTYTLIFG